MGWKEDQDFERNWWGGCENTFTEETKQLTYAYKMGLTCYSNNGKWPCYDLAGKNVIDIGGGPVSLLLKCENRGRSLVVDPCRYPTWIWSRYWEAHIEQKQIRGEDLDTEDMDTDAEPLWNEAWIYNVLQHTQDPEKIITNARCLAPVVRIFEWLDIPAHEGHPQELKEEDLNKWLNGVGTTEQLSENGCYGRAYYGVFKEEEPLFG